MSATTAKCIVITGASSGLGTALASAYAQQYGAQCQLMLIGRQPAALDALASRLAQDTQAQVATFVVDVRDAMAMQTMAEKVMARYGTPHLVIANAGVSRGTLTEHAEDIAAFQAVMDTNVMGLVHTFQPFLAAMKTAAQQGSPAQLVGIASVAGIRGLPGSGAYSASKAAAITYLESLRVEMQPHHISVTTIAPGYVRTPMTAVNTYPMPFIIDADDFAQRAVRAIANRRRYTVIPWPMAIVSRLMRLLPACVWDALTKNAPHKSRQAPTK